MKEKKKITENLTVAIIFAVGILLSVTVQVSCENIGIPTDQLAIRDPFVVVDRVTKTYYIHANRNAKRVVVYKSKDLKTWEELKNPAFLPDENFWGTKDFWAPDVYFYNNKYYMFITVSSAIKPRGTTILVANKPEGPFQPLTNRPITPECKMSLDGSLFIDEDQNPWMLYCREWLEVIDGEIYAMKLSKDLKIRAGEPVLLFKASEAPWVRSITSDTGVKGNVTDAPFLYRTDKGTLIMLWSSFNQKGQYAIGQAISRSGKITGPWEQVPAPLNDDKGGHAMLFLDIESNIKISYHSPNNAGRLTIRDVYFENDILKFR